jgi:ERF superfamily
MSLSHSESIKELSEALSKAQSQIQPAVKSSENPFFHSKYADLASVWDACREALTANGLSVVQSPSTEFGGDAEVYTYKSRAGEERAGVRVLTTVRVTTRLCHVSGQWLEGTAAAMLPNGDPQPVGSAITYLRRYALAAMVGVAPEDDDAESTADGKQSGRRPVGVSAAGELCLPGTDKKWDGYGGRPITDPAIPTKTLAAAKRWCEKNGSDAFGTLIAGLSEELEKRREAEDANRKPPNFDDLPPALVEDGTI